jgi:hypothetical protein
MLREAENKNNHTSREEDEDACCRTDRWGLGEDGPNYFTMRRTFVQCQTSAVGQGIN